MHRLFWITLIVSPHFQTYLDQHLFHHLFHWIISYICVLLICITVEFEKFFGNFVYMFLIQYVIHNYFSQGMTHLFIFLTVSFSGQKFLILINLILTDNLILNNLILIKSNLFFIHGIRFWHCSWKLTTKSNISPMFLLDILQFFFIEIEN